MRLAEARIDSYGPVSGRQTDCGDGINVVYGPNESGKTLHLEAILRLLEPEIVDAAPRVGRLDARPAGRVVLEHGGDHHELGDGTVLSDVCAVDAASLHNVFVVRDADLDLRGGHDYYASLTDTLGDIHTAEIEAIQSELKARGRLTEHRWNVASNEATDQAGTVRDDAKALTAAVEEYVEVAEREGLDDLEAERLSAREALREVRSEREGLERARRVAEYERLSRQLATYRSTTADLQALDDFEQGTLEELRERRGDVERAEDRIEEVEASVRETTASIDEKESELDEVTADLADLERREPAVDAARERLETCRDSEDDAVAASRADLARPLAIAAVLGAGVAIAGGALATSAVALLLGTVLLLVGASAALVHYRAMSTVAAVERAREDALRDARDAGLSVEEVAEIPAAVESFRGRLQRRAEQRTRLETELEQLRSHLEEARSEVADLRDANRRRRRSIDETLESADVEDVEAFAARVAEREAAVEERKLARRSLVDRFGDTSGDDPADAAAEWKRDLERLVEDVDVEGVDPSRFDEDRLEELHERESGLEDEVADLTARLGAHDEQLRAFESRARTLATEPFVGEAVTLESRSTDGLDLLVEDLEAVVERIERDAERSRKALDVFGTLESAEEEKITDLFAADGVGSRTFARLTDGRYDRIDYDPEAHELQVERRDGRVFTPTKLSSGTADQLYLATRISLARQLLGGEPGFLLLDDAFLTADGDRLRNGFEVLQDLAASGWQIVYFTSKREVGERTVAELDLECTVFDSLVETNG